MLENCASGKAENKKIFKIILRAIAFLARQKLPLTENGDQQDSNFNQVLHLESKENASLTSQTRHDTSPIVSLASHLMYIYW